VGHTIVLVESDGVVGTLARQAFQEAGIPWEECYREDRGSLVLVLVPPQHALDRLPSALAQVACDATPHARLRVAIHPQPGELTVSGVDSAFRLLADPQFVDLVIGAVDVGIVAADGVFAAVPAGAVVRPLAGAQVFLFTRSPAVAAMDSASEGFRLAPFPDDPGPFIADSPSTLLRTADRVVPFFGRQEELAWLAAWRDKADTVSVLLIHGPGGQGKTRLAAEFAGQTAATGWRTLQAIQEPDPRPEPGGSLGGADVMVVADYAERWPRAHLTGLLQHVLARRPGRVRLVLIARQAGYWWKGLANPLLKVGAGVSELRLGALADTVAQRRLAFAAARDRFAELLGVTGVTRLRPAGSLDDDAYRLALTLHMAALAAVDAHARGAAAPADPGSLSQYLVGREQDHWQTMVDNGRIGTRPEVMARLVAIATLTQSLPQPDAEALVVEVGLAGSAADARAMVDDHSRCYPSHGVRVLTPLLPDRLGEDFLAELLPNNDCGDGDPWTGQLPAMLVNETARHTPAALSVLIETAARWEHVRRDHLVPLIARQPELVLRAEGAALVTLAGYADLDLLETLTAALPERHVELDSGIAALVKKLSDFALARTDDNPTKARLYGDLAARLSNAGLYEDAVCANGEGIAIRRLLAEHAPDTHEPGLADALGNAGIDLWHAGLLAESVSAMREAVDIYRRRAASDPDVYTDDLAAELTNLTGALIGMGRFTDALAPAQEATATFLQLSAGKPGFELEVAAARRNLAIVLGNLGRRAESLPAIESAVSTFRRLADDLPHVHAADLAESLQTLGNQLAAVDRHDEALAVAQESVDILRCLATANPAAHEQTLVLALTSLANRLWKTGDHGHAIATDEEAAHLASRHAAPGPARGLALNILARHLSQLGEHDAALAAVEEAVTTWRALAAATPNAFHERLARALAIRKEITDAMESTTPADEPAGSCRPAEDGMGDRP
jgi:tetratricopeptide (TPR) repeat protein